MDAAERTVRILQDTGVFPDCPEGNLQFAIVSTAITDMAFYNDATPPFFASDAHWYMAQEDIPACEVCKVNSDLVRKLVAKEMDIKFEVRYGD